MAVTVAAVAVARDTQAQEAAPQVTIDAKYPTALEEIDDLVFTVTRSVASEDDLEVPVTLSSGVIAADRLSHTVTIAAGESSAELTVVTDMLDPAAATGDVTATVGSGESYDVGDPSSAAVRVYVGETLVTLGFDAVSYSFDEDAGSVGEQVSVVARTEPGVAAPAMWFVYAVSTRAGTASPLDDYEPLSVHTIGQGDRIAFQDGMPVPQESSPWVADGDAFTAEFPVPLVLLDDDEAEGDETLTLVLETGSFPSTVRLIAADPDTRPCSSTGFSCQAEVTIVDDEVDPDPADQVVVTLAHVPDGTVIPDDSTVGTGATVVDGTTFAEDERAFFRLLFSDSGGGPALGGANVELSFEWIHNSPIVPTSGAISRSVMSLPRVDVWDSWVQILDNDIGNPDSTLVVRITRCWRNGCIIGTPSEIAVTIADDDGGLAASPPGRPDRPRLVCAPADHGHDPTGAALSWTPPSFVGGAAIEDYDVQYRRRITSGDHRVWGDWKAWPHTGTTASTTITGLDADALHGVRAGAGDTSGPGPWSLPGRFWPADPNQICIPDELTPNG